MCWNIKTLFNFDPATTDEEILGASLQFMRKISGFNQPSRVNESAFNKAVDEVAVDVRKLLNSLVTSSASRDRKLEAERARARTKKRFGN